MKILLVDDEPDMLFLLGAALASSRWKIVGRARNGEEALGIAGREAPDLAVIDYMMPGLDGFEVASRLRAMRPGCYNLVFSAHSGMKGEADRHASVDGFFDKDQFNHLEGLIEQIGRARGLIA